MEINLREQSNYKNRTEKTLQNQIADKAFYHDSKHIVIQQFVYEFNVEL